MTSPITTATTPTITTTSDVSPQDQNSNLSTESTITSAENRGCCQSISTFFGNIVQWIKDHLCCCFSRKAIDGTTTSTETTTETTTESATATSTTEATTETTEVTHEDRLVRAEALRIQIEELVFWEPLLPEAEKDEVITDADSPHLGKTKEEAWNEKEFEWHAHTRIAGQALTNTLRFLVASDFRKLPLDIRRFLNDDANWAAYQAFIQDDVNGSDLQFDQVGAKLTALRIELLNLRTN